MAPSAKSPQEGTSATDANLNSWRYYLRELYRRNQGLLLIGCSAFTGSLMMVIVKLLTNQDPDVSEEERQKDHIDPLEVNLKLQTDNLCSNTMRLLDDSGPHGDYVESLLGVDVRNMPVESYPR